MNAHQRLAALSIVAGAMLLAWNCGDSSPTPVAPSTNSVVVTGPITEGQPPRSGVASDGFGAQGAVEFPARDQTYQFGQELNTYYRDVLKRGSVGAYVDLEGWIVWIQEYLRYRVNLCSHADAAYKVGVQIGGGGVPPVCGDAPAGLVNFPPRDQSYQFGLELNQTYRDVLRRGTVNTNVDLEGWIVWIQEYLRYRVNYCNHVEASNKVFTQIAGGGVQPVCKRGSYIRLTGGANACACWIGTITVWIDGAKRGTLTCNTSLEVAVSPGTHSVEACDVEGCVKDSSVSVGQDETYEMELYCTGAKHSFAGARR
jgi:hypothetical protein